jgi:hypothetical protein
MIICGKTAVDKLANKVPARQKNEREIVRRGYL